jgi:non-canonical poly(A) RNA polymerase PAPD5/7
MSRLPPLPPGLPPKPTGDSYRPGVSHHENSYASREREREREREPLYRFGAGDSYGSRSSYGRRSPPRYDSYAPGVSYSSAPYGSPLPYGQPPQHSSADVYRSQTDRQSDRPPNDEFSFRHAPPPSIDARSFDLYRSRSPPRRKSGHAQENHKNNSNNQRAERQRNGGQRGAQGYRGRGGPRMASDREFLKGNRAPTPELMQGMEEDGHDGVRYKAVEDMSDSEEAEMEMSEDEEDHDDELPKKKVRTEGKAADGDSAPRWSNPDPYTVLPPVDESQRKKKDVVKLIRKARVEVGAGSGVKPEAVADDFISLNFGDEGDFGVQEDPASNLRIGQGVAGAPAGPRAMLQQPPAPPFQAANGQNRKENEAPSSSFRPIKIPSKPNNVVDLTQNEGLGSRKRKAENGKKAQSQALDTRSDPNLGSRKRNADDELKPPPNIHKTIKGKPPPVNGEIVKDWSLRPGQVATPWIILDHSDTANMGVW